MSYEFDCPHTYTRLILYTIIPFYIYSEQKYKDRRTSINEKSESFQMYHIQSNMSFKQNFE